jgi:hypothetical protein
MDFWTLPMHATGMQIEKGTAAAGESRPGTGLSTLLPERKVVLQAPDAA